MTIQIERLRSLLCAVAAAVWLAGPAACVADNRLGIDNASPDDDGGATPAVQYTALSYDPMNDQLVVGAVGGTKLFAASDGHKLQEVASDQVLTIVARRAGGMITAVDEETIRIFDEDGNLLRSISQPGGMFAADVALDGSVIATGDTAGRVHVFRAQTGGEIAWPAWPEAEGSVIYGAAFSPDGATLAASSLSAVRIWRVSDGALLTEIPGFGRRVAFSSTGELAIDRDGPLDIFAIPAGTTIASYPVGSSQPYIVYSADGTLLALGSQARPPADPQIQIIDRVHGAQAVNLVDDPQTRPAETETKGRYMVALTFAGPDRIAVAWDDGRLAMFGVADGARLWSRLDSD